MSKKMSLSLDDVETEILLVWMKQASHTTFTDPYVREAMRELKERLLREVKLQQMPHTVHPEEYGDFS
jgi:hypothetical protein